jgi:hypothetical protein
MSPYIDKTYNDDAEDSTLITDFGLLTDEIEHDTLTIGWANEQYITRNEFDENVTRTRGIANGVSFTFNISEKRERNNLFLTYTNKPKNDRNAATVTKK